MAKKKNIIEEPVRVSQYSLPNLDKVHRAKFGSVGSEGRMFGGVGENASEEALLAEYDRLGGLILDSENRKIAMGSFYDFVNRKPKEVAEVELAELPEAKGIQTENVGDEDKR